MTVWQSVWTAIKTGSWVGAVGTLIGLAATIGLLSADQADAATTAVSGVATLIAAVMTLVHTLHAASLLRRNARLAELNAGVAGAYPTVAE